VSRETQHSGAWSSRRLGRRSRTAHRTDCPERERESERETSEDNGRTSTRLESSLGPAGGTGLAGSRFPVLTQTRLDCKCLVGPRLQVCLAWSTSGPLVLAQKGKCRGLVGHAQQPTRPANDERVRAAKCCCRSAVGMIWSGQVRSGKVNVVVLLVAGNRQGGAAAS